MANWISEGGRPLKPGWYPTLANWGTATKHPGAHLWNGRRWSTSCPERIERFWPEAFEEPHEASSLAHTLDGAGRYIALPEPSMVLPVAA